MTPGVINLNYLSLYLAKIENQGQFRNPQNKQISKLTLLFKFGEDLRKLLTKYEQITFLWTRCIYVVFPF